MLAFVYHELGQLAAEREHLQPLEVNLQAAAGKTAHAKATLAKARERKDAAAKELRARIDAFKEAEKEVADAEDKLRTAEAAATAKRSDTKITGVQEAVDFLQKTATERVGDDAMAGQVAAALQQIAQLLGTLAAGPAAERDNQGEKNAAATGAAEKNGGAGSGAAHSVFAVCGASKDGKGGGVPVQPQNPAALAHPVANVGDGGESG